MKLYRLFFTSIIFVPIALLFNLQEFEYDVISHFFCPKVLTDIKMPQDWHFYVGL